MNQTRTKLSCTDFQAQLSDLISSGATIANDPHLMTCENCRVQIATVWSSRGFRS